MDEVLCFKVSILSCIYCITFTLPIVFPFSSLFYRKDADLPPLQCGEKGHYANHCRNRNVPGNRGGVDRSMRRYDE